MSDAEKPRYDVGPAAAMVDHAVFSAPFDVSTLEPDQLFNLALAAFLASGAVDECDVRFVVLARRVLVPTLVCRCTWHGATGFLWLGATG